MILIAGTVGIAFAAIFVRLALPAHPVVAGFWRMTIASTLAAGLLVWRRSEENIDFRSAVYAAAAGLCFGTDLALWNTSLIHTSVATATLLVNITPVHVGLFSILVLGQSLDRRLLAGAGIALGGTAILVGDPGPGGFRGAALALAASLFYAGYLLLMKSARRSSSPLSLLVVASITAAIVMGVYAWIGDFAFTGHPGSSWAAIFAMALISQLGGVFGIVWALRDLPATVASVALLAQPVGTALLGWWILGEAMDEIQMLGGLAVLIGIGLAARTR